MADKDKDPTVIGGQPGQVVIKREGYASEVKIPWQQIQLIAVCNFVIYLALTGIAIIGVRLFGFWLLSLVVLAGGGWLCRRLWQRLDGNWIIVGMLATMIVTVAVGVLPQMMRLHLWGFLVRYAQEIAMVWSVGFLVVVVIYPFLVGAYRYTGEVIDPSGPSAPRTAIAWPGVVWPWQVSQIFRVLNPPTKPERPEPVTERVQVELVQRDSNGGVTGMDIVTLLEGQNAVVRSRMLARRVLASGISQRGLVGQGRPLSGRDEYDAFVDRMIARGWGTWRNPDVHQQGMELTVVGRKVLEKLAQNGNGATPLPHSEGA